MSKYEIMARLARYLVLLAHSGLPGRLCVFVTRELFCDLQVDVFPLVSKDDRPCFMGYPVYISTGTGYRFWVAVEPESIEEAAYAAD